VSLADGTGNRQPHPQAITLGREEGLEQHLAVMRTDPGVLHCDEDAGTGLALPALARDVTSRRGCAATSAIASMPFHDQVQDQLLQLDRSASTGTRPSAEASSTTIW